MVRRNDNAHATNAKDSLDAVLPRQDVALLNARRQLHAALPHGRSPERVVFRMDRPEATKDSPLPSKLRAV
jgi:hypothetical protein